MMFPKESSFAEFLLLVNFLCQLNGFAGPATWMAANKKLPSDIKLDFFLIMIGRVVLLFALFVTFHWVKSPSFSNLLKTEELLHKLKRYPKLHVGNEGFVSMKAFKKMEKDFAQSYIHKIALESLFTRR